MSLLSADRSRRRSTGDLDRLLLSLDPDCLLSLEPDLRLSLDPDLRRLLGDGLRLLLTASPSSESSVDWSCFLYCLLPSPAFLLSSEDDEEEEDDRWPRFIFSLAWVRRFHYSSLIF